MRVDFIRNFLVESKRKSHRSAIQIIIRQIAGEFPEAVFHLKKAEYMTLVVFCCKKGDFYGGMEERDGRRMGDEGSLS